MKCQICSKDERENFDQLPQCKVCLTYFCPKHGDAELMMCEDCIEAESGLDGEMGDLNG